MELKAVILTVEQVSCSGSKPKEKKTKKEEGTQ
jgi:hypothetical protein